ncbi:MAG: hypothetical protein Q9191_004950 [Dirinaria sp. TL-2023a]
MPPTLRLRPQFDYNDLSRYTEIGELSMPINGDGDDGSEYEGVADHDKNAGDGFTNSKSPPPNNNGAKRKRAGSPSAKRKRKTPHREPETVQGSSIQDVPAQDAPQENSRLQDSAIFEEPIEDPVDDLPMVDTMEGTFRDDRSADHINQTGPAAITPSPAAIIPRRFATILPPRRDYQDTETRLAATKDIILKRKQANGSRVVSVRSSVDTKERGLSSKIDERLRPISKVGDMFYDMVSNALGLGLQEAVETLWGKTTTFATMCSGTESPLLAMKEIQRALQEMFPRLRPRNLLHMDHAFSAEIEPFKQAYIARNFPSTTIFRDVRELALDQYASTVHGSGQAVPLDIDILVAGFSCVDFSSLNQHKKGTMSEYGESSATFKAIIDYAKRSEVKAVILENVVGAPWAQILAIWQDDAAHLVSSVPWIEGYWGEHAGFACAWVKADSRNYYIPHTRSRGYMICLNKEIIPNAEHLVQQWSKMMEKLRRPASCPVESFLLAKDDIRLINGREQMIRDGRSSDKPVAEINWELSRARHSDFRDSNCLGVGRPITHWVDGGSCKPVEYWDHRWHKGQVERIWDSLDINVLRALRRYGMDWLYKSRIVDISQNIDRCLDTHPFGVVGCLTSTGIHWLTTRGGPLLGREALILQGLPVDRLILSRETEKELLDLAGNAMTSTVVGAALIAAITVACKHIGHDNSGEEPTREQSQVQFSKQALKPRRPLDFAMTLPFTTSALVKRAKQAASLCLCEGPDHVTTRLIRECRKCYHTTCEQCGGNPEHYYGPYKIGKELQRIHPRIFEYQIKKVLPTRIRLTNIDIKSLASVQTMHHDDIWSSILSNFYHSGTEDLRFRSIVRNNKWTVSWSSSYYRMDLILFGEKATWFLYALPEPSEPAASRKRKTLASPIARMEPQNDDIMSGSWHIRVPPAEPLRIKIIGRGNRVPAWEATLGLTESRFADQKLNEELSITLAKPGYDQWFEKEISGEYELLADCDTANHSLYKRRSVNEQAEPLFLFLDPHPYGNPERDYFVFAREKGRLDYRERRHILARLSTKWQPTALSEEPVNCFVDSHWTPVAADFEPFIGTGRSDFAVIKPSFTPNIAFGIIASAEEAKVAAEALVLQPEEREEDPEFEVAEEYDDEGSVSSIDGDDEEITSPVDEHNEEMISSAQGEDRGIHPSAEEVKALNACANGTFNVMSCSVTVDEESFAELKGAQWTTVQPPDYHAVLAKLSFMTNRISSLDDFRSHWRPLALPTRIRKCPACAPKHPELKWQAKGRGKNSWRIVPYEDEYQAALYEEKMRGRPNTVSLQICRGNNHVVNLRVGINAAALAHQALAILQGSDDPSESTPEFCTAQWRLDVRYQHYQKPSLRMFQLSHNRRDRQSDHLFQRQVHSEDEFLVVKPSDQLRPEQTRSLGWMISREDEFASPFLRQEVVERFIPEIGFRVEALARQSSSSAKGGVLADQVGYGKTVTALGLIDAQMRDAMRYAKNEPCVGQIPTKATLIIVPGTLVKQWQQQAETFLGCKFNVVTVTSMTQLNSLSVREIQEAGIVIASWTLFSGDRYTERVAYLAALPPGPPGKTGGRPFETWLKKASTDMSKTLEEMRDYESRQKLGSYVKILNDRVAANEENPDLIRRLPTRRHKGARFNLENKRFQEKRSAKTAEADGVEKTIAKNAKVQLSDNVFKWKTCKGKLQNLTGLPLHAYRWDRIIVDEYTYVGASLYQSITTIRSRYRWVLSGTPRINNFADVKELAGFLGLDLGVDDDTPASMSATAMKRFRAERSSAETFRAFNDVHSHEWYEQRSAHAQRFLDMFVRQNRAEIEEIPSEVIVIVVTQTPVERAQYLELEQQLRGQDMRIVKMGKSKSNQAQASRLRLLYNGSTTAEEALLKAAACSDFKDCTARTPDAAYRHLLIQRSMHMSKCKDEMAKQFKKAIWLLHRCSKDFPDVHFEKFRVNVENGVYVGDEDTTQIILAALAKAEKDYDAKDGQDFFLEQNEYEQLVKDESNKLKKARAEQKEKMKEAAKAKKAEAALAKKSRKQKNPEVDDQFEPEYLDNEEPGLESEHGSDSEAEDVSDSEVEERIRAENEAMENIQADIDKEVFPVTAEQARDRLRSLTAQLRRTVREYVELIRGARYLLAVRHLQQAQMPGSSMSCRCVCCGKEISDLGEMAVLGKCGHMACANCLNKRGKEVKCVEKDCQAPAESHHIHYARNLGVENSDKVRFGSKIDAVIAQIRRIPRDEQVLVFVQWADVGHILEEAFKQQNIDHYSLLHPQEKTRTRDLDAFRNYSVPPSKPAPKGFKPKYRQVLLLNSSDESAAGVNLTGANHVIFVSPLLAETQHSYNQSFTQCVGRARRFGQQKTVFVYKFVALHTQDVDEYQERLQCRLLKRDNKWIFELENKLTEEEDANNKWGTGFVRKNALGD